MAAANAGLSVAPLTDRALSVASVVSPKTPRTMMLSASLDPDFSIQVLPLCQ